MFYGDAQFTIAQMATDDAPRGRAGCPAQPEAVDRFAGHPQTKRLHVANPDIGTNRVCPETGRKFYDLNKTRSSPPYTGRELPAFLFRGRQHPGGGSGEEEEVEVVQEVETEDDSGPEIVALEEAEEMPATLTRSPASRRGDVEIDDDDDVPSWPTPRRDDDVADSRRGRRRRHLIFA